MRQLKNIHSQQKGRLQKPPLYRLEFAAVVGIVTAVLLVVLSSYHFWSSENSGSSWNPDNSWNSENWLNSGSCSLCCYCTGCSDSARPYNC